MYVCICVYALRDPIGYIAHQAPLSMEFSRQEYRSTLFPALEHLQDPRIRPMSLTAPALAGRFFYRCTTWEAHVGTHRSSLFVLVIM